MFDYLKKRVWKKKADFPAYVKTGKKSPRRVTESGARQEAVIDAQQLPDDENEIVEFIMNSSFAEARYIAAQKLHTKEMLEKVRQEVHRTDGRVTKLMQTRLNEIERIEKQRNSMRECILLAEKLKNEDQLLPNRVAELDRQWADVNKVPSNDATLLEQYATIREEIRVRLENQTLLQRQIMDIQARLESLEKESSLTPDQREAQLENMLEPVQSWKNSREWGAMPQRLIAGFEETTARIKENTGLHAQNHAAIVARESVLDEWESQDVSALLPGEIISIWRTLPAISDPAIGQALQQRFDALADALQNHIKSESESAPASNGPKLQPKEVEALFSYSLSLMQEALQEGAIREAVRQNEQLTLLDYSVFEPEAEQQALLAELRSELKNLVGWARWGGAVSREELIRIAESLPGQKYPIRELAAAVVELREKWKALNQTAGMATRSQWQQFDAACNKAYTPILEHARTQGVVREQNRQKVQAIFDSTREMMAGLNLDALAEKQPADIDWRQLVEALRKTQRAWRQIGTMARREKKLLDEELEEILKPLNDILNEQTKIEVQAREELIEAVKSIRSTERKASRKVRQLQEQWQEKARAFPLESREDQKLWTRFRAACEEVFAHRALLNEEAEKEFGANLDAKTRICEQLEGMAPDTAEKILEILGETDSAWSAIGTVSKEKQNSIQSRYGRAVDRLLGQLREIKDREKNQAIEELIEKLGICQRLEKAIPDEPERFEEFSALWDSKPSGAWKDRLQARFDAAARALKEKEQAYRTLLESRQPKLMEQLLRLEIVASVESPPEFASERRQVQMNVLKDALSGHRDAPPIEQLDVLCAFPVLTDASSALRLERLIRKINGLPV